MRTHPDFFTFTTFDAEDQLVYSVFPGGGPYNLASNMIVTGVFQDFKAPRCKFGDYVGTYGVVYNASYATCEKPRFPDELRNDVGGYNVTFSPNGQCFPTASRHRLETQFMTYNSQTNSIDIASAPASGSVQLTVEGDGYTYPGLEGGICRFTQVVESGSDALVVESAATTISTTAIKCNSPATGVVAKWELTILQNGLTAEPSGIYGNPILTECASPPLRRP